MLNSKSVLKLIFVQVITNDLPLFTDILAQKYEYLERTKNMKVLRELKLSMS